LETAPTSPFSGILVFKICAIQMTHARARKSFMDPGGETTWTVTLRNDGDDDLCHVTVRHGRTLLDKPFDLAVGKGRRFAFTTTHKTEGKKTEKVTVTGIASNGESVRDEASTTVQVWEVRAQDGKEMVRVPAGAFLYGDGKERRKLPEFWIDKTPVTNAEYARFVTATGHKPPRHWKGKTPPEEIVDHPVVNVSWHDAVAYAEWAGKRLPTEEEWEKAARGTDGRKYPWGDQEPASDLCNFGGNVGDTTPVGKYSPQGDSPYGCVDMAGNVWEWTASDYSGAYKVLRGGSWNYAPNDVRGAYRYGGHPINRNDYGGFRCARGSK